MPDSYFRNRRDATISIAKLTLSDSDRGVTGHPGTETLRLVVDASPLVMAIWSLSGQTWTSPTRSPWSTRQYKNAGSHHWSRRRPRTCPHVHQRRATITPTEVATMFRVDPRPSHDGEGRKLTSIRTLGDTGGTGRLRFVHCSRVFRSSAPSDLLPSSPGGRPSGTAQGECGSTRSMKWGVGPGGGVPHRGCCPAGKSPARHIPEGRCRGRSARRGGSHDA